ncbi:MAG: hypothetical protein RLN88_07335 [Ekhidna sp.]|uniref:hypothetical protein n=1 Tax=Ekhidna sp. TaxID=2608089 RepID=UPI0032EE402E
MPDHKAQLQTIKIIHLGLMAGPAFLGLVAAFLVLDGSDTREPIEVLDYLSPGYFLFAVGIYPILFKSAIKPAKVEGIDLGKKIATYQTGHIIRLALLEGAALFAGVVVVVNGQLLHLITLGLVLAIMFSKLPSPYLLESELGLSPEEKEKLA